MFASSFDETRQTASAAGNGTVPTMTTAAAPISSTGIRVAMTAAATRAAGDCRTFRTTLCMLMQDSTPRDCPAAAAGATMADALRAVAVPFVLTRGGVLLVGLIAAVFIGYTPEPGAPSAWRVANDPVRNLLARWDAFWYMDVATRGYHWNGNPLEQQNVVFFPLFPLLMRGGGAAIGGHPLLAGLSAALAAFFAALCYFWRWTADRLGSEAATNAVWLLTTFPTALFFSAVYTESVFLLLVVAACYYAERGRFAQTAVLGFLAGLVRPNGFLLAVPLAWIAGIALPRRERTVSAAAAVLMPIAGMLCYCGYLGWRFGDPIAWIANQAAWPDNFGIPPPAATPSSFSFSWILNGLPLGLVLVAIGRSTSLFGVAYGLFIAVNIAPPLLRHGLLSVGRFSSVMFPVFAWLATRATGRSRPLVLAAFAIAQAVLAAMFFTWQTII